MQDGVFANGDNSLVDIVFSIPFDSIQQGHIVLAPDNHIVYIDSLRPTSYKLLEDIKGVVISDYQSFLEKEWISQLKKKHEVTINNELFVLAQMDNLPDSIYSIESVKENLELETSFSSLFVKTVNLLGASKSTFFGWNGQIYNTEINLQ